MLLCWPEVVIPPDCKYQTRMKKIQDRKLVYFNVWYFNWFVLLKAHHIDHMYASKSAVFCCYCKPFSIHSFLVLFYDWKGWCWDVVSSLHPGGFGGTPSRKFWNLQAQKVHFQLPLRLWSYWEIYSEMQWYRRLIYEHILGIYKNKTDQLTY